MKEIAMQYAILQKTLPCFASKTHPNDYKRDEQSKTFNNFTFLGNLCVRFEML